MPEILEITLKQQIEREKKDARPPLDYQSKRIYMRVGWEIEKAPTLLAESQCSVCYAIENHPADSRVKIEKSGKVQTLTNRMGTGGGNIPLVLKKEVFREGTRPHSKEEAQKMAHGQSNAEVMIGKSPTLNCNHEQLILCAAYIVRRLTPTECARLQGFPGRWGGIDNKVDFTGGEYHFWLNVRNTHAAINGRPVKEYSKKQMLNWYNKLHSDSAEYKMWGNGIALPTALYCMQGIAEAIEKEGK